MLERNRGARRDRTRRIVCRRSEWRVRRAIREGETGSVLQDIYRYYRRHEGRDTLFDKRCYDCCGGGPCDWCYGGTRRKQQRLHDSLDADRKEWDRR